jgi:hypothetical protein
VPAAVPVALPTLQQTPRGPDKLSEK